MWSILADNTSLLNVLNGCTEPNSDTYRNNFYVQQYLYALVLWESIYKGPTKRVSMTGYIKEDEKRKDNELIERVKGTILDLPNVYEYDYDDVEEQAKKIFHEEWYSEENNKEEQEIKRDALFYLTLGQWEGMNTLLSKERFEYVEKSTIEGRWSRRDMLDYIDQEVFEMYKDLCISKKM